MLDKYLESMHEQQVKTAQRDEYVALMMKLPVEELKQIHETGVIKLAYDDFELSGDKKSWLDTFKDTPLYPQAIALEEESLKAQAAREQSRSVEDESRHQCLQAEDTIRLQKKLLELDLAKQRLSAETAAMNPPQATPGMGIPPGMGAQGAGAPGDMAPEGAQDGAIGKLAAKDNVFDYMDKREVGSPSSGRGKAFLETVGDMASGGALSGGVNGGLLGAAHGAMTGQGAKDRILRALGHGAMGAGIGSLAGGAFEGAAGAPGAAIGAMSGSPLLGAVGGAGLGYAGGKLLSNRLSGPMGDIIGGVLPTTLALSGGAGGLAAGMKSKAHQRARKDYRKETDEGVDHLLQKEERAEERASKKKHANIGAKLLQAAGEVAKKHPAAMVGGGLGLAHGLMREDGGLGSGILEGVGGAALGEGGQKAYGHLSGPKTPMLMPKEPMPAATSHLQKEAFIGPMLGALGGAAMRGGMGAAAKGALSSAGGMGGLASKAMGFAKANPMKMVGAGMNAASNFAQARQSGEGMGGAALSGLAGGASALG